MRILLAFLLVISSSAFKAQPCSVIVNSIADCGFNCSGSAWVAPQGQSPFTYLWQPGGENTESVDSLCAGIYTVTVTDSLGCVSVDSIEVYGSPILNVWITSLINPSCVGCADGSASGSVSGGTPGYWPYWIPPVGWGVYSISNISAGPVVFCVIDTFGCESCVDTVLEDPLSIHEHSLEFAPADVELYDISGRLISISDNRQMALNSVVSGSYILITRNKCGAYVSTEYVIIK